VSGLRPFPTSRPPRCYLACAEPSWSSTVPASQLAGLLNLCCLFSPVTYLSDVQLGDNAAFLETYEARDPTGLYERVRVLAQLGFVRVLLRDASVRPNTDRPSIECESFSDVYASWIEQDPRAAWINAEVTELRGRYFKDLDSWGLDGSVERYSYRRVKEHFMLNARQAHTLAQEGHNFPGLDVLPLPTMQALNDVLSRDWFSLSDIYRVLHDGGIASHEPVLRYHGLINELAYAQMIGASVAGVDTARTTYERLLWADDTLPGHTQPVVTNEPATHIDEILSRAREVLTAPDLSILGILRPEEIAGLREGGRGYFDVMKLAQDTAFVTVNPTLESEVFRCIKDYWAFICDEVSAKHPAAAKRPTRLGIFLGHMPRPFARVASAAFGFALNVGTPMVSQVGLPPPANVLAAETIKHAGRSLHLRFLVVRERDEMKHLRELVPARSWVTARAPSLYLPPGS
jgi:hypothetical protein